MVNPWMVIIIRNIVIYTKHCHVHFFYHLLGIILIVSSLLKSHHCMMTFHGGGCLMLLYLGQFFHLLKKSSNNQLFTILDPLHNIKARLLKANGVENQSKKVIVIFLFSHGFISGESSTCQRVPNWEDKLIISFRNSTYLACSKKMNFRCCQTKI